MSQLHLIDHPMIQHKLTIMRKKETGSKDFRILLREISLLMGYEITRDLPLDDVEIETPICKMTARKVSGRKMAIVPILRAGLGMVEGLQTLVPVAKVGHIGLYRDETTHNPVVYYCKLPEDISQRLVIVTDRWQFLRRPCDAERARLHEYPPDVPRRCPGRHCTCPEGAS